MPRLVYVAAIGATPNRFMRGQLADMKRRGYDVTVIASPGPDLDEVQRREGVDIRPIEIPRAISLKEDLRALREIIATFRELRPDIVNAGTPKGGLLGMIAARVTRVPARFYHLRGLRMETAHGWKRAVLTITEHVASKCSTRVLCNSESLRNVFVEGHFATDAKTTVLHRGSANGVDASRFVPNDDVSAWATDQQKMLGIGASDVVIGFVGRFTRDKGLDTVRRAFEAVTRSGISARLLLVGDFDETDPVDDETAKWIRTTPGITVTGFIKDPERYYAMIDVLVFPSHREGFPNVPLEAAAAAVPVVGYRATGTVDAIVDGETGTLVNIGDDTAFSDAVVRYAQNKELRTSHGSAAQARVLRDFAPQVIWAALAEEYARALRGAR